MFYGATIKPGATVKLASDKGELLHISGACLSNPVGDDRTSLMLNHEEKTHVLCVLKKDHAENVPLDIFVPTRSGASLKVQGKSEISVIGYFEPSDSQSDMLSDEGGLALDDDESTQVSSEDEKTVSRGSKSNLKIQDLDDEDEEEEDEEEDDDMIDEEGVDDKEDEDEEGDEEDEELMQALQKQIAQKKAASKATESKKQLKTKTKQPEAAGKKRKAGEQTVVTKPEKQQKTGGSQNAAAQQFEKAIFEYLKKHGRSLISQVASACPKPAAVSVKYREFLVSRPSAFIVDGQHAALKS